MSKLLSSTMWLVQLVVVVINMAAFTDAQSPRPPVLDTDGQPLIAGTQYYLLPVATEAGGGTTIVQRNDTSCPFAFIVQEPISQGLPLIFTPRAAVADNIIRETRDFTILFFPSSQLPIATCNNSATTGWIAGGIDPQFQRRLIASRPGPELSFLAYFNVVKNGVNGYSLTWCPNCTPGTICLSPRCSSIGIQVAEDGKRLLAMDVPLSLLSFKKRLKYDTSSFQIRVF